MNTNATITISKKMIAFVLATMLVLGGAFGGTVAWLLDTTEEVVNTFTYGDITIDLWETEDGSITTASAIATAAAAFNVYNSGDIVTARDDLKIVPGNNIAKDPFVTVLADSEDCWLFIEVEETDWPTFTESGSSVRKVGYTINKTIWTQGDGTNIPSNVYYISSKVELNAISNQHFQVLADNEVVVSENLTKEDVAAMAEKTTKLTFTAYAVQYDAAAEAKDAWALVKENAATETAAVLASTEESAVAAPATTEITADSTTT